MCKAAALIAKGATVGGVGGAAAAALKNPKATLKLAGVALVIAILPILLIAMLPLVIFNAVAGFAGGVLNSIGSFFRSLPVIGALIVGIGSLFGAADEPIETAIFFNNAFDTAHIVYNLEQAHELIGLAHFEQYQSMLANINKEIVQLPESREGRIIGIEGDVFQFNTSIVLGMYAASLHDDVMQISLDDLRNAMNRAERKGDLFDYIIETESETRTVYPDPPEASDSASETQEAYEPPEPVEIEITVHSFIVVYKGEMLFAEIFGIADNERKMSYAHEYARNLMTLLTDTDIGGWFGIILEAGEVEGFYSPFPEMAWTISSPFGWRTNPITRRGREFHSGIDIPKPVGTPIRAIADGYVILSQFGATAGNWIQIDHGYITGYGNVISEYMHNSRNLVAVTSPHTRVTAGQVIAEVGNTGRSTGAHLHLSIWVNNERVNPVAFINSP